MHAAETVEHGQRSLQGVAVIKGVHIGIAVGLGVNGSSKVVLGTDVGIYGRQESSCGSCLLRPVVIQFQLSTLHLMIVLHGILHALQHRPGRLCLQII